MLCRPRAVRFESGSKRASSNQECVREVTKKENAEAEDSRVEEEWAEEDREGEGWEAVDQPDKEAGQTDLSRSI